MATKPQEQAIGKTELAEMIAANLTGINQRQVGQVLDALTEQVTSALQNGRNVALTGFGTFKTAHRKARAGVNLRTQERIQIPERMVAQFTPGTRLRGAMQNYAPRNVGKATGASRATTRGTTHYASSNMPAEQGGGASGGYAAERAIGTRQENAPGGVAAGGQASAKRSRRKGSDGG